MTSNVAQATTVEPRLAAVVARATFLFERLYERGVNPLRSSPVANERIERWRRSVGPPTEDWLTKRLAWDQLDREVVTSALDDPAPGENRALPAWAVVLQRIVSAAPLSTIASPTVPGNPLPFEELLVPAVIVARQLLDERLGAESTGATSWPTSVLSEPARRSLERELLLQLSDLAATACAAAWHVNLPSADALIARLDGEDGNRPDSGHYVAFVHRLLDDGLLPLFDEYPVLARMLATSVTSWAEATAEFVQRFHADRPELADVFQVPEHSLIIRSAIASRSDRHRGGRTVTIIECEDGTRLVYKPKPLGLEVTFNRLLQRCNEYWTDDRPRVITVIDRETYGWAEFVEHRPCESLDEARHFYRRAGRLLCLIHVLRGVDCHYENLIASGEHPVLVDAEALLCHTPKPLDRLGENSAAEATLEASVVRTGMLPSWRLSHDEAEAWDLSALGDDFASNLPTAAPVWQHVNTDAMHIAISRTSEEPGRNTVWLNGSKLRPYDYTDEICAGFEATYRFVLEHHDRLLAPGGALEDFREQVVRFICRPTRIYLRISTAGVEPPLLRSGIDFGIHLEQLARAYLLSPERPPLWPVLADEIVALQRLDVPIFTARAAGVSLDLEQGPAIDQAFAQSGYASMVETVARMSEADLDYQLTVIRGSFAATVAHAVPVPAPRRRAPSAAPMSRDQLVHEARQIGLAIEKQAFDDGDEGASWLGLAYLVRADRFQLQLLNDGLYDGTGGIAVFLAALGAVSENPRFARLARRAFEPSRRRLRLSDALSHATLARLRGIGGAAGLGSVIYAYVRAAAFLGDPSYLGDAEELAGWLTSDAIDQDSRLDMMSGAAGALLGLLALYAATGSTTARQSAQLCGEHLLRKRAGVRGGRRVWRTVGDRALTGFSHGAAGIALALARLHAITKDARFLEAAVEAIAFERDRFSKARGNWPDYRSTTRRTSRYPVKWCHGAPGIVLARLGCAAVASIDGVEDEIRAGIEVTRRSVFEHFDFACCGNVGRIEALSLAAAATHRDDWRMLADQAAASVVARARATGGYRLFVGGPRGDNPTFFQGLAGIGYQWLRLADETLPSILRWD